MDPDHLALVFHAPAGVAKGHGHGGRRLGHPFQVVGSGAADLDEEPGVVVSIVGIAADVRTLAAFPVAAAQVRQWIAANLPTAELRPAYSNADAARQVAEGQADAAVARELILSRLS